MHLRLDSDAIRMRMNDQALLAAMTVDEAVRSMHEDLERLYRTQLVATLLKETLSADTD